MSHQFISSTRNKKILLLDAFQLYETRDNKTSTLLGIAQNTSHLNVAWAWQQKSSKFSAPSRSRQSRQPKSNSWRPNLELRLYTYSCCGSSACASLWALFLKVLLDFAPYVGKRIRQDVGRVDSSGIEKIAGLCSYFQRTYVANPLPGRQALYPIPTGNHRTAAIDGISRTKTQ